MTHTSPTARQRFILSLVKGDFRTADLVRRLAEVGWRMRYSSCNNMLKRAAAAGLVERRDMEGGWRKL